MPRRFASALHQRAAAKLGGALVALLLPDAFAFGQAAAEAGRVIEEVVVTAQKREQDVQGIPVSVVTLGRDAIEQSGLQDLRGLTELDPGLSFDNAQSFQQSSLKIRGIGTIGNTRSFEGAVGVFVDGVYRPRSGMVLGDLLDIERIEILRGPQGTLFGKNTVAGAIALSSAAPSFDGVGGAAELRLGNYGSRFFTAGLNLPVNEEVAARVAATTNTRDGATVSPDNGARYDSIDRFGVKGQLLYAPTPALSVRLIVDHAESDADCCWSGVLTDEGPTTPLISLYTELNGLTFTGAPQAERERRSSLNTTPRETVDDTGLTLLVDRDFGQLALRSITSVRNWQNEQIRGDADFSGTDIFVLSEAAEIGTLSQEFNLTIPFGDDDDLLLGVYYAKEDYESHRRVQTGSDADDYLNALISTEFGATDCLPPLTSADCVFPVGQAALLDDGEFAAERYFQDSLSLAAFAHASIDFSDAWRLVAGGRYSREEKDGGVDTLFWYDSAVVRAFLADLGIPDDGTPRNGLDVTGTVFSPSFTDGTREDQLAGTLSLQYFANNDTMLFAGVHTATKAGGVNLFREGVASGATTYDPEQAVSVEAGVKADFWRNRARTNLTLFHTEFEDLQINFFTGLEFRTENTGRARTTGVEFQGGFQVTDDLRVDVAATWLDARFVTVQNPQLDYLVDRRTPRAPELAGNLALTYQRPVGETLEFFVRGMASYMGSHFVGADVREEQPVDAYTTADASIGITSPGGGWDLLLWCTNCANTRYRQIYFNSTFQPGSFSAYLNNPRLYGVSLRGRF
jgi:iron complex outermembrane receptor protein